MSNSTNEFSGEDLLIPRKQLQEELPVPSRRLRLAYNNSLFRKKLLNKIGLKFSTKPETCTGYLGTEDNIEFFQNPISNDVSSYERNKWTAWRFARGELDALLLATGEDAALEDLFRRVRQVPTFRGFVKTPVANEDSVLGNQRVGTIDLYSLPEVLSIPELNTTALMLRRKIFECFGGQKHEITTMSLRPGITSGDLCSSNPDINDVVEYRFL